MRRAAVIGRPASVFILVLQDVTRGLVESRLIDGAEQRMQQDVVGLEGGIGFELAAPLGVFLSLRKQVPARSLYRSRYPADKIIDLPEAQLWRSRGRRGGGVFHSCV